MEKILEAIADYHNEDPEAFQDMGKATRAKELIEFLVETGRNLTADPYDIGSLLANIVEDLSDQDLKKIQGMLTIR